MMQSNIKRGVMAGLIAGIVFGILLQVIALRTPAGSRVILFELVRDISRPTGLFIGWAFHLFDCVIMGAIFGALMGKKATGYGSALKYGALYSAAWWVLGGIFLMPIFLGLSIFSPQTIEPIQPVAFQSLIGHVLYGLLYGGTFVALRGKAGKSGMREHAQAA